MKIPMLITTDKRGVFFGMVEESEAANSELVAEEVQMCVYWPSEVRGVLGLAAVGPLSGSRVTKPTKKARIHGITMTVECSSEAVEKWKSVPWS